MDTNNMEANNVETANENEMLHTLKMIETYQKKSLLHKRISTVFLGVILIAVLVVVPNVLATLRSAQTVMSNMNNTIAKMDTAIDSITVLADTAGTDMQDALKKVTSIDIDTLNEAISDLNEVVSPMADFFGRFR